MHHDCRNILKLIHQTQLRLASLKTQICSLYPQSSIRDALEDIADEQHIISVASISEFLIKNGIYYTQNEIIGFIQEEMSESGGILPVSVQLMFQNRFMNWLSKDGQEYCKESVSNSHRAFLLLRLCQLLSQGIRERNQNIREKEVFRQKWDLKKVFRGLSDGKLKVELQKVQQKLKIDRKQAEILWNNSEKDSLTFQEFCQFFDFQTSQAESQQNGTQINLNPKILNKTHFLNLSKYMVEVAKSIKKIEQLKQDLIQRHQEASAQNLFLLLSPSLDKQLTARQFMTKCQELDRNGQFGYLFQRYAQDGVFTLKSARKLFDPFDDAILAVANRRGLSRPTMKLLQDYRSFLRQSAQIQTKLESLKIKSQNFGYLFMALDTNKDTVVCREDLHKALLGQMNRTYSDYRRVIYRFTMSTDRKIIKFQDFLRQMMPRVN